MRWKIYRIIDPLKHPGSIDSKTETNHELTTSVLSKYGYGSTVLFSREVAEINFSKANDNRIRSMVSTIFILSMLSKYWKQSRVSPKLGKFASCFRVFVEHEYILVTNRTNSNPVDQGNGETSRCAVLIVYRRRTTRNGTLNKLA